MSLPDRTKNPNEAKFHELLAELTVSRKEIVAIIEQIACGDVQRYLHGANYYLDYLADIDRLLETMKLMLHGNHLRNDPEEEHRSL